MSFLESIRRKEREKLRASAWSQAVGQLSRFIRHYLRFAEKGSGLLVTPDLLRVDNLLLDRLTLFFEGETVTATPLPLSDPRAGEGGCVELHSTNGTAYYLLWDGTAPSVPENWKVVRVEDRARAERISDDAVTADGFDKLEPLSDRSLDQALGSLFGLAAAGKPASSEPTLHTGNAKHIVSFALMDKRSRIRAT
jgi:hypothetical protein